MNDERELSGGCAPSGEGAEIAPANSSLSYREYAQVVPGAIWLGNVPWHLYGRALMPLCMPHIPLEVDRPMIQRAMRRHGALLACWTTEWDAYNQSEWWFTVCDRADYHIESIDSSGGRRSIRKGMRYCTVKRLSLEEYCHSAYPIYRDALERYGQRPPAQKVFVDGASQLTRYPGTELWGAFYEERLAAYAAAQVIDGAVQLAAGKSVPELHRYHPNSALNYTLCVHYLRNGMRYVSNGQRTLWHPTNIESYLETLGFRKAYCRINVELSSSASTVNRLGLLRLAHTLGLSRLFGTKWAQLEGFDRLVGIAGTFK